MLEATEKKFSVEQRGLEAYLQMKMKCLVCNDRKCKGFECMRKKYGKFCFDCGSSEHTKTNCPHKTRDILRNRACFSCMIPYTVIDDSHTFRDCPTEERMKAVLFSYHKSKKSVSFSEMLTEIYTDKYSFLKFLSECSKSD